MIGQLKPVVWLGSSRADLRAFPDTARRDAGEFRVMYIATFADAVPVLHVFQKKTQRTRERDIALARRRLADLRRDRGR